MREGRFSEDLHIRTTSGLVERVQEAADQHGITVSEFVRGAIRDRLAEGQDNGNGAGDERERAQLAE